MMPGCSNFVCLFAACWLPQYNKAFSPPVEKQGKETLWRTFRSEEMLGRSQAGLSVLSEGSYFGGDGVGVTPLQSKTIESGFDDGRK